MTVVGKSAFFCCGICFKEHSCMFVTVSYSSHSQMQNWHSDFSSFPFPTFRHGIFPPVGRFPPIERSHGSFLRSVQIR